MVLDFSKAVITGRMLYLFIYLFCQITDHYFLTELHMRRAYATPDQVRLSENVNISVLFLLRSVCMHHIVEFLKKQ